MYIFQIPHSSWKRGRAWLGEQCRCTQQPRPPQTNSQGGSHQPAAQSRPGQSLAVLLHMSHAAFLPSKETIRDKYYHLEIKHPH